MEKIYGPSGNAKQKGRGAQICPAPRLPVNIRTIHHGSAERRRDWEASSYVTHQTLLSLHHQAQVQALTQTKMAAAWTHLLTWRGLTSYISHNASVPTWHSQPLVRRSDPYRK